MLFSFLALAGPASASASPIDNGQYLGQVHGDHLSWGENHPHSVNTRLNYREEADHTTTCSHVHCTHDAETGRITVHHASHEQHGDRHWCLHHMHVADKCGCECYDKQEGLMEHVKAHTKGYALTNHFAHQNFTANFRFLVSGTCEKAGFETIIDSDECATAEIMLLKMGKAARDSLNPDFDAYKDADSSFSGVPRGCVFHRQMPGQQWDTVQIYPNAHSECGAHNHACICKLPPTYYGGATAAADRMAEAHKAAEYHRLKDVWSKNQTTHSPTRTPTISPTAAPTTYNKCACGTTWQTVSLGSFCTLCPAGTYQPHPHDGSITACLPCPAEHSSTTGSCECTTNHA